MKLLTIISVDTDITTVHIFCLQQILEKNGKISEKKHTRCGNKETGLLLLLTSDHGDDEEEGRALTCRLPSTVTQRFIHAHQLVWP